MPTSAALSSSNSPDKGKGRARAPPKPASKSNSTPKRQGGRKAGAVKWTIKEFLRLFRVVAERRPSGNYDWQGVSTEHSLGPTSRSSDTCKGHWNQLLKLPKPTGRSRMHPLHRLGLAIDEYIQKSNSTYVVNDDADGDPYGELEYEFKLAEDTMKRLKLDFDRPPNFNIPLPDEDAELDDEDGDHDEDAEGRNEDAEDHDEEHNQEMDREDEGFVAEQDGERYDENERDVARADRRSDDSTELDEAERQVLGQQAARRSLSWDLEEPASPPAPPAPEAPAQSTPKGQATHPEDLKDHQQPQPSSSRSRGAPAPFPMAQPSSARAESSFKAARVDPKATGSPEKSPAKQEGRPVDPAPRKRPVPRPQRELTPEPDAASKGAGKSKALGSTSSVEVIDKPAKSLKRKAVGNEEHANKRQAQATGNKASSSKASGSKGEDPTPQGNKNEVIDLVSDDEDPFVKKIIQKRVEGNMTSIAFLDLKRKIQRLETELGQAYKRISELEHEIIELKHDLKVEAAVQAALAKRDKEANPAVPPVRVAPLPAAPQQPDHPVAPMANPFDPNHPFNLPAPSDNMFFDA